MSYLRSSQLQELPKPTDSFRSQSAYQVSSGGPRNNWNYWNVCNGWNRLRSNSDGAIDGDGAVRHGARIAGRAGVIAGRVKSLPLTFLHVLEISAVSDFHFLATARVCVTRLGRLGKPFLHFFLVGEQLFDAPALLHAFEMRGDVGEA